jgi:hypothetical protein
MKWRLKPLVAAAAGLGAAFAASFPVQATSIQDFLNDAVISGNPEKEAADKVRVAGVIISVSTEAFRAFQVDPTNARLECIEKHFFDKDADGEDALYSHLFGATNKNASVEGYIMRAITIYCPPNVAQRPTERAQTKYEPTWVKDFYKDVVPDKYDKVTVLNMALETQAERLKLAGDEAGAQCADDLTVKVRNGQPNIPAPFKTDIMQALAAANRSDPDPSVIVVVEAILLKAIARNCGQETLQKEPPNKL